jgi:hypothetical protein
MSHFTLYISGPRISMTQEILDAVNTCADSIRAKGHVVSVSARTNELNSRRILERERSADGMCAVCGEAQEHTTACTTYQRRIAAPEDLELSDAAYPRELRGRNSNA